jgi:hypothetical protein
MTEDISQPQEKTSDDYAVGYRKPPKAFQF